MEFTHVGRTFFDNIHQLRHDQVHALHSRSSEFINLSLDNSFKCHVRSEQTSPAFTYEKNVWNNSKIIVKFQKGIQMSRKDAVQITKALVLLKQKRKQDLIKNWQICDPSFLFSLVSVISVWSNFFTTIFGYIESEIWPWLFKSRIALSTG